MESKKAPQPTRPCLQIIQASGNTDIKCAMSKDQNQYIAYIDAVNS